MYIFQSTLNTRPILENSIKYIRSDVSTKVSESEKEPVRAAIEKLRGILDSGDTEAIRAGTDELQKAFYPIAEKIYAQSSTTDGGDDDGAGSGDGSYYNSDFEDKTGE